MRKDIIMSQKMIFPIQQCPICKSTEFKVNVQISEIAEIIVKNGEISTLNRPNANKIPTINKSSLRKSWICSNCNNFLFHSKDIIIVP